MVVLMGIAAKSAGKDMTTLAEWVEESALENLRFRLQNAETLAKEAATTLTIILAGIAGSLAYGMKIFAAVPATPDVVGSVTISMVLMIDGFMLVFFCMLTSDLQVPTNEPRNLFQKEFTLEQIREVEINNIQARISDAAARNHRVAAWLDRCRLIALSSPLISAIVAFFWAVH